MEEWGIGEIYETLKAFTSKAEDVEQIRASSEKEITDLSVLDAESMEILVVEPAKLGQVGQQRNHGDCCLYS